MDVRESLTPNGPEEFRRWLQANLKRVRKLIAQGRMTEAGLEVLSNDFKE